MFLKAWGIAAAVAACGFAAMPGAAATGKPGLTAAPCPEQAWEEADATFDAFVSWARNGARPDGDEVLGDLTNAGMKFTNPLRPGDPGMRRIPAIAREPEP